jgi:hypothetical protein
MLWPRPEMAQQEGYGQRGRIATHGAALFRRLTEDDVLDPTKERWVVFDTLGMSVPHTLKQICICHFPQH